MWVDKATVLVRGGVLFLDYLDGRTESIVFKSAILIYVFIHVIIKHAHGQNTFICASIYAKCHVTLIISFLFLFNSLSSSSFTVPGVSSCGLRFLLFFRSLLIALLLRTIFIFATFFQLWFKIFLQLMWFYWVSIAYWVTFHERMDNLKVLSLGYDLGLSVGHLFSINRY